MPRACPCPVPCYVGYQPLKMFRIDTPPLLHWRATWAARPSGKRSYRLVFLRCPHQGGTTQHAQISAKINKPLFPLSPMPGRTHFLTFTSTGSYVKYSEPFRRRSWPRGAARRGFSHVYPRWCTAAILTVQRCDNYPCEVREISRSDAHGACA